MKPIRQDTPRKRSAHFRKPISSALVGVLALLGTSASAAADEYEDALAAMERRAWAEAIPLLERSIAAKPKARPGGLRRQYLPYYKLGVARYESGDCAGALAAWAQSLEQGAVQEVGEAFADLKARRVDCGARQSAVDKIGGEIRTARGLLDEVGALGRSLPGAWTSGSRPAPSERHAELTRELSAVEGFGAATRLPTLDETEAARRRVAAAIERLVTLKQELEQAGVVAEARATAASGALRDAIARAEASVAESDDQPAADSAIVARMDELRSLIGSARGALVGGDPTRQDVLRRRLEALTAELGSLEKARPSEDLVAAATAYFAGEYSRALEILESDEARALEAADAALLRAATYFALHALGGGEDPALLAEARSAVDECRALDPGAKPTSEHFSPRFVHFFRARELEAGDEG